jgi:hypothetical protein
MTLKMYSKEKTSPIRVREPFVFEMGEKPVVEVGQKSDSQPKLRMNPENGIIFV